MRKIILALILVLTQYFMFCQSSTLDWLNIGLVMPEEDELLDNSQIEKLQSKLSSILANNGVSSNCVCGGIMAYPKISLNNESSTNTGMATLKVIDLDMTLYVAHADDKTIFGSNNVRLRGIAKTKNQAILNALNSIEPNKDSWTTFFDKTKSKIVQYYDKNCARIMEKAELQSKTGNIESAIMQLMNIPLEVPCYNQAKSLTLTIYKKFSEERCTLLLQEAKTKLALKQFEEALAIIAKIDPNTSCFTQANAAMTKALPEINEEIKKQWNFLKTVYNDSVALEKMRIKAIRDIGVAYGSQSDNYTTVIK